MTDLRLVAVTPERSHLVLEDDESRQYRVPIDERLAAALRNDRPRHVQDRQLEITLESQLTPREIQTRIRSGQSAEEVAAVAGISVERVEKYALPVIAEREHVVELAQAAPSRRQSGGSAPTLGDLVAARLQAEKIALSSVSWDSWRADETSWTVRLAYADGARDRVALWTFDPRSRVLAPADDEARWLVDASGAERAPDNAAPVRRLTSIPGRAAEQPAVVTQRDADEVYDREADERADEGAAAAVPERPQRQAARAGRRPAVPSWDDIMFGTRRRD